MFESFGLKDFILFILIKYLTPNIGEGHDFRLQGFFFNIVNNLERPEKTVHFQNPVWTKARVPGNLTSLGKQAQAAMKKPFFLIDGCVISG